MKKLVAGLLLFGAVMLASLSSPSAAQAYGDNNPPQVSPTTVSSQTPSALPNTGGPNVLLLGGALVMIVLGGTVLVARRRTTA